MLDKKNFYINGEWVSPKSSKETQEIVTFYMKTENGEEKAKETFKLKKVPEPKIVNLALNFNSYP